MKVLVAEDDPITRDGLREILENEGYRVVAAADGAEALALFERESPDFVCLDVMMPGRDGFAVCRALREQHPAVPIVFISAKGEEIDKVVGLELGADDFIVKPFGVREVVARVRAVARRCIARRSLGTDPGGPASFRLDDLEVFPRELRARRDGHTFDLSPRDVRLLELFHGNPGRVLDRDALYTRGWGEDYLPDSRTLDQHISQLRKRIEADPRNPRIIRTVHGAGYRYEAGLVEG